MTKKSRTKVEDAAAQTKPAEVKPAAKSATARSASATTPKDAPAAGKARTASKAKTASRTTPKSPPPPPAEVVVEALETVEPIPANRPVGSVPRPKPKPGDPANLRPRLSISSRNYSSWSLRGWMICKMAGLEFDTVAVGADDPSARAELLLMAPSYRVPRLRDGEVDVWDTLAIADYLHETHEASHLYPREVAKRAHCRAVCGEMHSGFANLRSALPFNVKGHYPGFKIWAGAQADIDHICEIWRDCLARYGGPFLFGPYKTIADAMFAPVCSRFVTYDVQLDAACAAYRDHIMALPLMQEWIAGAMTEPDEVEELDMEF